MSDTILFNYMLLSASELHNLFWQLSNNFIEGVDRKSIEELQEIRSNLKSIVKELEKRQIVEKIEKTIIS